MRKTFLTSLVGNLWTIAGFRVNSYSGEGGLISFFLILLEENAILPMTPKADSLLHSLAKYTIYNRQQNK